MQHQDSALYRNPYPLPDVYIGQTPTPAPGHTPVPISPPAPTPFAQPAQPPPRPPNPDFLIVGLFALRLARKLICSLDYYSERVDDIMWLDEFLRPYHPSYDLAKITGACERAYIRIYPDIVSRMKRQSKYPTRFMDMNPAMPEVREAFHRRGGMTDTDRVEMINFVDAAGEWGSTVLVPKHEAQRMIDLAS